MPAPLLIGAASLLSKIHFGGIKGASYPVVTDESLANAAISQDWTRIAAVARGGTTDGLPYNNSDNKGGWKVGQRMDWSGPAYAQARSTAQQLLDMHNLSLIQPTVIDTPGTFNNPIMPAPVIYAPATANVAGPGGGQGPASTSPAGPVNQQNPAAPVGVPVGVWIAGGLGIVFVIFLLIRGSK